MASGQAMEYGGSHTGCVPTRPEGRRLDGLSSQTSRVPCMLLKVLAAACGMRGLSARISRGRCGDELQLGA